MKLVILTFGVVMTLLVSTGAVFAQTATPTSTTTPTITTTVSVTPTGSVQGATIPSGAPATGRGGQ